MSEASSSPLSRSPTKPLEYTACIDTHLLSSSPNRRQAALSAYDMTGRHPHSDSPHQTLRERRQSKELNNDNHPHRHALERDLRRLDIDCNSHILAMNNKPLNRTESISLPTTPIEQMSSTFHQKRHRLLIEHRKSPDNNHDEQDDDDDDDDDDDEQTSMGLTSPTDDITALSEQEMQQLMRDEALSNSKR